MSDINVIALLLLGAAMVWLPFSYAWLKSRQDVTLQAYLSKPELTTYRLEKHCRGLAVLFFVGALGLILLPIFVDLPIKQPSDNIGAVIIGAIFIGFGAITAIALWRTQVCCSEQGLAGISLWTTPRYMAWQDVESVSLSNAMMSYKLSSRETCVYVPFYLEDRAAFIAVMKQSLATITITEDLEKDPHQSIQIKNTGKLRRHAPWAAAWSFLVAMLSTAITETNLSIIQLSVLVGVIMSLVPVARAFAPQGKSKLVDAAGFLSAFGMILTTPLINRLDRLAESYTGLQQLAVYLQPFSFAILTFSLIIIVAMKNPKKVNSP